MSNDLTKFWMIPSVAVISLAICFDIRWRPIFVLFNSVAVMGAVKYVAKFLTLMNKLLLKLLEIELNI